MTATGHKMSNVPALVYRWDDIRKRLERLNKLEKAARAALYYMRLHKYADQAWADDLEAALKEDPGADASE